MEAGRISNAPLIQSRPKAKSFARAVKQISYVILALLLTFASSINFALALPCCDVEKPPAIKDSENIPSGLQFTHTKDYDKEMSAAISIARKACEKHRNEGCVAIVADIDETLFDNRPFFEKHQTDFKWSQFFVWMQESEAPLLPKTAAFLSWARSNGYAVFLVTGRNDDVRAATTLNLIKKRISYDGLFMRKVGDKSLAEDYKASVRKGIEDSGFKIIVNIGDQLSDLYGGHAEQCVKLPNRMYYIP